MGTYLSWNCVDRYLEAFGVTLISSYRGNTKPLAFICPKGHFQLRTFSMFQENPTCTECNKLQRIEEMREKLVKKGEEVGVKVDVSEWNTKGDSIKFVCAEGHITYRESYYFLYKNQDCSTCRHNKNIKLRKEYRKEYQQNWEKEKITFNCDWCGKECTQILSNYNRNPEEPHYCSRSCVMNVYWEEHNKEKAKKLEEMIGCACGCGEMIHKYRKRSKLGGLYEVRFKNGHRGNISNTGQFSKGFVPWNTGTLSAPFCVDCGKRVQNYSAVRCGDCDKIYRASDKYHSPNWLGKEHNRIYPPEFSLKLRQKIRDREDNKCFICHLPSNNKALSIHHIDYDKNNCVENNLVALCLIGHAVTNWNREYWQKELTQLMIKRGCAV